MSYRIIFILILLISVNIYSTPKFTELNRFGNGFNSHCITIADFYRNANLDVAVGNVWDERNQLYVNIGDLNFDLLNLYSHLSTKGMTWGDYNNDGMLDLAAANNWYEENILYIQICLSVFALLDLFGLNNSHTISCADYDNYGDLGLAVAALFNSSVNI